LAHALIETQQSEADDRGTRDEKRCEVNGVECPNWVTGKRLTGAIDDLGRNSQNMPISRSRDQVRAAEFSQISPRGRSGSIRLRRRSEMQQRPPGPMPCWP
jgi:hypothetical protein